MAEYLTSWISAQQSGRVEVEDGSRKMNGGVIVHESARNDPEPCFCDRQLGDAAGSSLPIVTLNGGRIFLPLS